MASSKPKNFSSRFFSFSFAFSLFALGVFALVLSNTRDASAISTVSESAYRAAEKAIGEFLEKIEDPENKDKTISSLSSGVDGASACSDSIIKGENLFGTYRAEFLSASESPLSCSDRISRIVRVRVVGFFGDESISVNKNVVPTEGSSSEFRCTGTFPRNAVPYAGDDDNLSANLAWRYVTSDTSRKCEFHCKSDAVWDGSTCVLDDDGGGDEDEDFVDDGGEYVTTGPENQKKQGAFGARGAFKAYNGISVNGKKIQNVAVPIVGSDLATKAYVDEAVRAAFGGN